MAALAILYAGEFLPKLFCAARPLHRMLPLSGVWSAFELVFGPVGSFASHLVGLFLKSPVTKEKLTAGDLLRILEDRKDGVKLTDFESALISRILVLRKKGRAITSEELLRALDDEE